MKQKFLRPAFIAATFFIAAISISSSCNKENDAAAATSSVPDVYKKIYGAESISVDGDYIVITTNDLPDHKSVYYENTKWADSMYEAYNGSNPNFFKAMGSIVQQNLTFRIPMHPKEANSKQATNLGPIGVALNGVSFFNQYNGQNQPLTVEINTFDQYYGHPTPTGEYHYHAEPVYLTQTKGKDALLGFLLDGFPVYGLQENGSTITDSDLDEYHGHFGATADYPDGIYHYHITAEDPYINGNGYFGTPGTVSN